MPARTELRRVRKRYGSIRTLHTKYSAIESYNNVEGSRTVVVNEIRDSDAEQCAIEAGIEASYSFSLDYASDRVVGGRLSSSRFDLSASGECD